MTATHSALQPLLRQITSAFDAREQPHVCDVAAADPEQHSGCDPESDALVQALHGRSWQAVDVATVRTFKDALPLLTPAAFVYYLPAWLQACLRAPQEVDSALDAVIFNLTPPRARRGWRWRFFLDRATLFNTAEADAIVNFLAYEQELEKADWASAGRTPPSDRLGRPLDYWRTVAANGAKGE